MKLAVLGKGGSGKSSVSWLLIKELLAQRQLVLAIDADHNMDLMANLQVESEPGQNVVDADEDFRELVGLTPQAGYKTLAARDYEMLPKFSFTDDFTTKYATSVEARLRVMNGGLGEDEVLFGTKCAHAYLSPLKYYLPLLELNENETVVIDSVAGIDMVNFGLYAGIDALVVVVNNHPHSLRVLSQILRANETIKTKVFVVINKHDETKDAESVEQIKAKYGDLLLAVIPKDAGVYELDYTRVQEATKAQVRQVLQKLPEPLVNQTAWSRVQALDLLKLEKTV